MYDIRKPNLPEKCYINCFSKDMYLNKYKYDFLFIVYLAYKKLINRFFYLIKVKIYFLNKKFSKTSKVLK